MGRIANTLTLILTAALCLAPVAASPARAAACPREIEVIVIDKTHNHLDEAQFISLSEDSFGEIGMSLGAGLVEPDYVLTVTYRDILLDGVDQATGWISFALGFTGGTLGERWTGADLDNWYHFYGKYIGHSTFRGESADPNALGEVLPLMCARIEHWIRNFERMTEEGSVELLSGCYRPDEAREVTLHLPPGPYDHNSEPSMIFHRYIVTADAGTIRNGSESDVYDGARVFVLYAQRDAAASRIHLDYVTPAGVEKDHITVWNSCDVKNLPLKHQSTAEKHELVAEGDIPVCRGYRLEYAHEFTIEHGGAALLYTLTGEVRLRLIEPVYDAGRLVGGRLEGTETLPVTMFGAFRDCTVTYSNTMATKVTGEIRREFDAGGMKTIVQVKLEEDYGTVGSGIIDCPDQDPFATGGVPAPTVVQGSEAQLVFTHVNGDRIARPFSADGVTGDAVWILHVPER
jgi:hypothetical protein